MQRSAQKTAKGCTLGTALCCLFGLAEAGMPLSGQMPYFHNKTTLQAKLQAPHKSY